MASKSSQVSKPEVTDHSVALQFAQLESDTREEYDDAGWQVFNQRVIDYVMDLYVNTRRECLERTGDQRSYKYSAKDVERASIRVDYKRFLKRKQKRYGLQVGTLACSILTGIVTKWAFDSLTNKLPWILLIMLVALAIILASVSVFKEMEP